MTRTHRLPLLLAVLALTIATLTATTAEADVPDGAQHQELYFEMADGTSLHADVLRDADVGWDVNQPVIMTVSPYLGHTGSTMVEPGLVVDGDEPNERFHDFLALTDALEEGYTYVLVDLPGFGGSGGCNDWGGRREQGAVHAAIEWGAKVDFATGEVAATVQRPVGHIGKSYDGWTGLMAMAQDETAGGVEGLAAVVSMEPVFSGYRYLYNNGVALPNAGRNGTVGGFQQYDAKPGSLTDDPEYHTNQIVGGTPFTCYPENWEGADNDRADSPYWVERDLVPLVRGSDVPLFLTQGWLETNTKVDAALDFWNAIDHSHGHNRAWFGQFNHVRGWDRQGGWDGDGDFETGKDDFVEQMMEFFDLHLKGEEPHTERPAVEVQSNLGDYRAEDSYPPSDMVTFTTELGEMTFTDVPNNGDGSGSGVGTWAVSEPLDRAVHMAGDPRFEVTLTTSADDIDYAVNIYDIDEESGVATNVSRGTYLVRTAGEQTIDLQLYGQDWVFEEGHRIGVILSGGNEDWWNHVDTDATVPATDATVTLPLLTERRTDFLPSDGTTPRLEQYSVSGTIPLDAVDMSNEVDFDLPGPGRDAQVSRASDTGR